MPSIWGYHAQMPKDSSPGALPPLSRRTRAGSRTPRGLPPCAGGFGHTAAVAGFQGRSAFLRPLTLWWALTAGAAAGDCRRCGWLICAMRAASSVSSSMSASATSSSSARCCVSAARHVAYASSTRLVTCASISASVSAEAARGAKGPLPSSPSHATGPPPRLWNANPHCATMRRARERTCCRSSAPPVVTPSAVKKSSSATVPPSATAIRCLRWRRE
mmetsp:Transcript_12013/g.39452  ORF Transcript_12013/g.39452 Transcript_12013/m.39452 type:complete len:218 (-) Transcript_12013:291-944(-)